MLKTNTVDSVLKIKNCGELATRKYAHGFTPRYRSEPLVVAQYFFENRDMERLQFRQLLLQNGFEMAGFSTPYLWEVKNDDVRVKYVEGDVFITKVI